MSKLRIQFTTTAVCLVVASVMFSAPYSVSAEDYGEIETEVSAAEAGVSAAKAASVTAEETSVVTETGTLIEIGNTTAEETTVIVRTTDEQDQTEDVTLQIDTSTSKVTDSGTAADLSDWIAGDQITFTATEGDNSGELSADTIRNRSFKRQHKGRNGFIKEIRIDANEIDVEWAGKVYTLNTANAKLVAGNKNPATLADFKVGDRVRARVTEDNDGDNLTWDAQIVVVLRRGNTLFMRVTRWVVPAEITALPTDTSTFPYTIMAKVLESKFYEAGDVNNLIGPPGTEISIDVFANTKLVRRFMGGAEVGEFSEGDHIRVVGRLNESTHHLDAKVIKNNSIQRLGVATKLLKVVSIDAANYTLTALPIARKTIDSFETIASAQNWTIVGNANTLVKENGADVAFSAIQTDDVIRIRGVANRLLKKVTVDGIAIVTDKYNSKLTK